MNATNKKCPMCAEQIPLEAKVCEYCGTRFDVSVKDGQVESRSIEEPVKQPVPATLSPSSATKQGTPWGWIAGGLGLLLILALLGGGIMVAQNGLPFLATPTNTPRPTSKPRPTSTPNYASTQQRRDENATATVQASWVQGFSQPIINEVHNRQPNFEDDFSVMSGRFARWSSISPGVTFPEGVMRINTSGTVGVDAGGSMNAKNFVLEFEFIPRIASERSTTVVNFRWNDAGGYNFDFNLFDTWWGLLTIPKGQEVKTIAEGWSKETGLNRTTLVIVIAKDNRLAFYANGKPLTYLEDSSLNGDWVGIGVWAPNAPAEVDFDNVKFWDLDNLKP